MATGDAIPDLMDSYKPVVVKVDIREYAGQKLLKRGNQTKYDLEKAQIIIDSIGRGETMECAAALSGVSISTIKAWKKKSRLGEEPYIGFADACKKAERAHESRCVQGIFRAACGDYIEEETVTTYRNGEVVNVVVKKKKGKPDWCAYAWLLERKWPDEYGKEVELMRQIKAEFLKRKQAEPLADAPSTTD